MGTAISWVYVDGGGTAAGSAGAMGTGAGGCITWKVGCSDSSDAGGIDAFEGSDGSGGSAGGIDCGTSGTATGAGIGSTCIVFEQFEYLELKKILSIDHLIIKLVCCYLFFLYKINDEIKSNSKRDRYLF